MLGKVVLKSGARKGQACGRKGKFYSRNYCGIASHAAVRPVLDFLGFPRELRDMVYHEMLPKKLSRRCLPKDESPLGLLLANKQIKEEFEELLYRIRRYQLNLEDYGHYGRFNDCSDGTSNHSLPRHQVIYHIFVAKDAAPKLNRGHIHALANFQQLEVVSRTRRVSSLSHQCVYGPIMDTLLRLCGKDQVRTVELSLYLTFSGRLNGHLDLLAMYKQNLKDWKGLLQGAHKKEVQFKVLFEDLSDLETRCEMKAKVELTLGRSR